MIRMLLADDNRVLVRALLVAIPWAEQGVEVAGTAYDGVGILEQMNETIDVLVTDVRMPHMDGVELTRRVAEKYPDIQVVFLSAYSEFSYAVEALKLSVTDYITKPVDNDRLLAAVLKAGACRQRKLKQKKLLEESLPYMREHILTRLLAGDAGDARTHASLYFPEWKPGMYFTCMVFELFCAKTQCAGADLFPHLWNCKQLVEYSFAQRGAAVLHGGVVALVLALEAEPSKEETKEWIAEAKQVMERLTEDDLCVTVGMSRSLLGLDSLGTLYQQAVRALGMRFLLGRNGVFVCPATAECSLPDYREAQNTLDCMEGIFRVVDEAGIDQRLALLQERLNQIEDRDMFILTAYETLSSYVRNLLGEATERTTLCAECLGIYNRIAQGTRSEGVGLVLDFIRRMQRERFSQMQRENKRVIRDIYRAIEKVGFDSDGGLERIAQEVFLSPSYVSMLFKQETGQSISKVLNRRRLDRARTLLQDPDLKIYEISEQVGYPNPYYFSVWFKKNTGLTPTEYRRPFEA